MVRKFGVIHGFDASEEAAALLEAEKGADMEAARQKMQGQSASEG